MMVLKEKFLHRKACMSRIDKIQTWTPDKLLLSPFKFISIVKYPPLCGGGFHTHDMFQELMVMSGLFKLVDPEGNKMHIRRGEMLIIPPGKPHAWSVGASGCKALQISHQPLLLENYGELSILFGDVKSDWQKAKIDQNILTENFGRLKDELDKSRPADGVMIFTYLLEIFVEALRRQRHGKTAAFQEKKDELAVKRALDYIQNHFHEKITLRKLCHESFLGPSRFSEVFRRSTGCSPIKYLNRYRLEKARIILAYAELSVKEVADHLGFESIHYFSRAFKKHFGCNPSSLFKRKKQS